MEPPHVQGFVKQNCSLTRKLLDFLMLSHLLEDPNNLNTHHQTKLPHQKTLVQPISETLFPYANTDLGCVAWVCEYSGQVLLDSHGEPPKLMLKVLLEEQLQLHLFSAADVLRLKIWHLESKNLLHYPR